MENSLEQQFNSREKQEAGFVKENWMFFINNVVGK